MRSPPGIMALGAASEPGCALCPRCGRPGRRARNDLVRAAPRRLSRPRIAGGRRAGPGSCARREAIILSVPNDATELPSIDEASLEGTEDAHPLQAGAPVRPDSPTFAELGVRPEIVRALAEAVIER